MLKQKNQEQSMAADTIVKPVRPANSKGKRLESGIRYVKFPDEASWKRIHN